MPRMYPATVRWQIVQRFRSGEAVAAVAAETGICQATLFRWKRQALIDVGVIEGTPSVEADELAAAHKRIAQLEAELSVDPGCVRVVQRRGGGTPKTPTPNRWTVCTGFPLWGRGVDNWLWSRLLWSRSKLSGPRDLDGEWWGYDAATAPSGVLL